jgi:pimeloyl-ACP methyl ester carboxylesterase
MVKPRPEDHLEWDFVEVDGRRVNFGVAGHGLPVLFVHGWALGQRAYKRALKRLVHLGCRVYAPALPGFGGSAPLASGASDIAGYAAWLNAFLDVVGVEEPVFAIGHSFGGGVVTKLAHAFPSRVSYLALINSVGGGTWLRSGNRARSMAERPLWDWAVHFPCDLLVTGGVMRTLRAIIEDAVPNLLANPIGVWRVGTLARRLDLTPELADLQARGLPVLVLWGEGDGIVPRASFDALCAALGSTGTVVPGRHSWLPADPDSFGAIMANSVAVARAARAEMTDGSRPGTIVALGPADPASAAAS